MDKKNLSGQSGGYCLSITREKLLTLWLAALLLFLGAAASVYGWLQLQADKTGWSYMEYVKLVIGSGGGLFLFCSGVVTAYTAVRDAFWPQKSTLANSIRSQLPYPEAAPGVQELFAMVDKDIGENGQWFDRVAVGKEWVLGETASYIPRIRLFFGRDEIKSHRSGNHVNTTRIVELYILDDRRQHRVLTLRNPKELQPLLSCISLRAPDALCRPYSEYAVWLNKSDMEWENMLREYRVRQGKRETEAFQSQNADSMISQNITLTFPDGDVTSRVTPDLVRQTLTECLKQGEGVFSLTLGKPAVKNGSRFVELSCFAGVYEETENPSSQELEELGEAELFLRMTSDKETEKIYGKACQTDIRTAEKILLAWCRGEIPNLEDWETVVVDSGKKQEEKRKTFPPRLEIMFSSGVFQSHDRFTLEDIEVAAEGLLGGSYRTVDLTLPGGYLWMQVHGGDKTDGRCRVSVTRADSDKLRYFRILCTHKQAAAWLMEFAEGRFRPDWKEWKDYTRRAEKENKKNRRNM